MTYDEALEKGKELLPDFETLVSIMCDNCRSEDYCPSYCDMLNKAKKIPFEKLQVRYQIAGEDPVKLCNYIRKAVV